MIVLSYFDLSLEFLRPFTVADSLKTTGALISCYITVENSMGSSCDPASLKNGAIKASSVFRVINSEQMFPVTKINLLLKGEGEIKRKETLEVRKKIPRYLPWENIKAVARDLEENDYKGISTTIVQDLVKYEHVDASNEDDRLSVNLSDPLNSMLYTREFSSFTGLEFKSGRISGMECWFTASLSEGIDARKFKAAGRLLEDFGLSGRRSTGSGHLILNQMKSSEDKEYGFSGEGLYLLLSKFIPTRKDIDSIELSRSVYSISAFSGKDSTETHMGTYRYFSEGSILYLKNDVEGRSYDIGARRFLPFFPILRRIS